MSNRLRRMDRFEREEECRGERWAYIVYGLSADARTDSARLKQVGWAHSRRAQRALLEQKPRLSLEDVKNRLEAVGARMNNHDRLERMARRRSKRSVDRRLARWLSADAPKPKRSLVDVVDRLDPVALFAGLAALLLAWLIGWVLG